MHAFTDLVHRSTNFTLSSLDEAQNRVAEELDESGATRLVKALQMIQLQKNILAVGMFSIFEATLQDGLGCTDGFAEAKKILSEAGEDLLKDEFSDLQLAINALKHGSGRSYDQLVAKAANLPFKVKLPGQMCLNEGDVSEVQALVLVDSDFVLRCAELIDDVSTAIKRQNPNYKEG